MQISKCSHNCLDKQSTNFECVTDGNGNTSWELKCTAWEQDHKCSVYERYKQEVGFNKTSRRASNKAFYNWYSKYK